MKRFILAVILLCAASLAATAAGGEGGANLVSCEFAVFAGMENENYTWTIRLDEASGGAMLTVEEDGRAEERAVPLAALDELSELMAACDPAGWSSLPDREEFALDAPVRRIALVYDDGSEYTITNDKNVDRPVFADAERVFSRYMDGEPEGEKPEQPDAAEDDD